VQIEFTKLAIGILFELTCPPKTEPFEMRFCSIDVQSNKENGECENHGSQIGGGTVVPVAPRKPSRKQIVGIIQEYAAGAKVTELCRRHGMSDATFYKSLTRKS